MLRMENEHESVNPQHEQNANEDAALQNAGIDPALLKSLEWRSIGPFRGGRVVAVAGDPSEAQVFYFGSTGGGTDDNGNAGFLLSGQYLYGVLPRLDLGMTMEFANRGTECSAADERRSVIRQSPRACERESLHKIARLSTLPPNLRILRGLAVRQWPFASEYC